MEFKYLKSSFEFFIKNTESRINETYSFLEKNYGSNGELKDCLNFVDNINQATSGENKSGIAVKLFSAVDAQMEFNNAINLASICIYKSSIDSLRRALEITLVGCYFDLVKDKSLKVFEWINSKQGTPFFSKIVKKLSQLGNFKKIKETIAWDVELNNLYWELSDFSHTKGLSRSIYELNKVESNTPLFNEKSLVIVSDLFIKVVKMVSTVYAITNPILLVRLPVTQKYGLNIILGIFDDKQSEVLSKIIPQKYKVLILEIIKSDAEIQKTIKKISEMPDSTIFQSIFKSIEKDNKEK